ncbi:hypothetical protein ABPG74_002881 [Tetrahymena malaccensis]
MINLNSNQSSNSVKVLCSNCKSRASYPLTLHCQHQICFKCAEKLNKKERIENRKESPNHINFLNQNRELNTIVCPQCKAITQTSNIYNLNQEIAKNNIELKENYVVNAPNNQQISSGGNGGSEQYSNLNNIKQQENGFYINQDFQTLDQDQQPQMLQNEIADEDFQFQNIPEEDDLQLNTFNYQIQQNQGNFSIQPIDPNLQQNQRIDYENFNQVQQIPNQDQQQDDQVMRLNDLQDFAQSQFVENQEQHVQNEQQSQFLENQFDQNNQQAFQFKNSDQLNKDMFNQPVQKMQQQLLYYEDDSLIQLHDNLRSGFGSGNTKQGIIQGENYLKKKSVHNNPSNESRANQNQTSSIQIRVSSNNPQAGIIINPHYYPQHARNNANRFKQLPDKNNFLKREQDNTQQSSSDFQIFQSNNNNNIVRFPNHQNKQQQEYLEIESNLDQNKYQPNVIQKLQFSPENNQQIDFQYNQQIQEYQNHLNRQKLFLPNDEGKTIMVDQISSHQIIDSTNNYNNQLENSEEQKNQYFSKDQLNLDNKQYQEGEQYPINDNDSQGQINQIQIGPQVIVTTGAGSINPEKPLVCKEHNDYVQLYCQDDKSLLCVNCLYQNDKHKRHRVKPLKSSMDLIKKENQQFKLEAKEKLQLIESSLKICNSNKNILKEGYSYLCDSVSREFAEIQKILIEQEKKIQMQIQTIFEERLKEYDQMLNDLHYLKSCIKEYKDCDKNTNQNLTIYVFSIYSMIRNTLKNIDFSFKQINKNDIYICDFKNNRSTIIQEIQSFGKVINDLNIRDPNTSQNGHSAQGGSHTSSSQKQNAVISHSNSKANFDSNKKGNVNSNYQAVQLGSLANSASKSQIQLLTPAQMNQVNFYQQNMNQPQQTPVQKNQPSNQKSSTTSLEGNSNQQIIQNNSQLNLLQNQGMQHMNSNFVNCNPFPEQNLNQQIKNPKSRNQTPSPYKHNQKSVQQQMIIGKDLINNNNIQYHRDFLDVQYEHCKKQTPRQISHHNPSQNQQQQQQLQQIQGQQQQPSVLQQQQGNNPHSSSYAKLIVSRSTKFSNKKQQQECFKEIQKCQTPPQDRRMNEIVKNIQNVSYYALLEEKYNKRSKSSQKKQVFNQNQFIQNK